MARVEQAKDGSVEETRGAIGLDVGIVVTDTGASLGVAERSRLFVEVVRPGEVELPRFEFE